MPFWNPALRAGFLDLGRGTTRGAMARAVLEGVAFHDRVVLERGLAACAAHLAGRVPGRAPTSDVARPGEASSLTLWRRRPPRRR